MGYLVLFFFCGDYWGFEVIYIWVVLLLFFFYGDSCSFRLLFVVGVFYVVLGLVFFWVICLVYVIFFSIRKGLFCVYYYECGCWIRVVREVVRLVVRFCGDNFLGLGLGFMGLLFRVFVYVV